MPSLCHQSRTSLALNGQHSGLMASTWVNRHDFCDGTQRLLRGDYRAWPTRSTTSRPSEGRLLALVADGADCAWPFTPTRGRSTCLASERAFFLRQLGLYSCTRNRLPRNLWRISSSHAFIDLISFAALKTFLQLAPLRPKAIDDVVADHADGLHEGVVMVGSTKQKPSSSGLAHRLRFGGLGGKSICLLLPVIGPRLPADERPDVAVEAALVPFGSGERPRHCRSSPRSSAGCG